MFKILGVFVLSLLFLIGCQQGTEQEAEDIQPGDPATGEQGVQGMPGEAMPQQSVSVSEEELELFAEAAIEAQEIDQLAQQEMMTSVEESGMDVQRYSEIQQSTQMPEMDAGVSAEEMEAYQAITRQLEQIQEASEAEKEKKVNQVDGMTFDRYMQILQAIQTDQQLHQQVIAIMQEKMGMPQQGQQPVEQQPVEREMN